jgi:DNA-binding LacI/PurR family transcriptional regulator
MDKAQLLRIALTAAQTTLDAFAEDLGVSVTMVYRVLDGKGTSARVSRAIDDFIAEHLERLEPHVRQAKQERRSLRMAA